MSRNKDIKDLIRAIEAEGGHAVLGRRSGHWKVYRGPRLITTLPSSPSDWRSRLNSISDLRRHGGFTLEGF